MAGLILDRQSVVPLYYQIQQALLESVREGSVKAGDPLPSEQEISSKLGVSRMTARQALKSLCSQGVAYSLRGKGTFVSAAKLEKDFRQLRSFNEDMQERGIKARSKVLAFEVEKPDVDVVDALHLDGVEESVRLSRIRLADQVPVCIETSHIPARLCPGLLKNYDPAGSLYKALQTLYGIEIHHADEVAEASTAKADDAKLLRVRPGAAVFLFTRTAYLKSGQPVEFVKSVYRGDRYKIVSRLSRRV